MAEKIDDFKTVMGQMIMVKNQEKVATANERYVAIHVEDENGENERCLLFTEIEIADMEKIYMDFLKSTMVAGRLYSARIDKKPVYLCLVKNRNNEEMILRISPFKLSQAENRAFKNPEDLPEKNFLTDLMDWVMNHKNRFWKIALKLLAEQKYEWVKEIPEDDTDGWEKTPSGYSRGKQKKQTPIIPERQKYVDDWTNTIQSSTPTVLVNPYDNPDDIEINPLYVLSYGNDKKTVFKPTTTKDAGVRKSVNTKQVSASRREVVSFGLSEKLGIGVIPPTYLTERVVPTNSKKSKKEGSEQAFVEGETWMQMCIKKGQDGVRQLLKDEKIQKGLGMISITDYLLGSADRHNKNLMIDNNNNLYAIDNGLTFASNNYQDKYGDGEFRSLPTDILFRMYQDYDSDYSISNMQFEEYNVTEFDTDFNQLMKLEVIKDAGGYHPDVEKFFQEMDYDKAEQTIVEVMQHYGMDEKSTEDTISRLRDIQGLFNY